MAASANRSIGLDIVRSVAILLVVLAHGFGMIYSFLPSLPANVINEQAGGLGVTLFFVLSGFLIGRIFINTAYQGEGNAGARILNFWTRRWLRTLPNYYLFLILYFIVGLGHWSAHPHFSLSEGYTPVHYVLFLQNLFIPNKWFFSQSWSLAVEEWFYLLLPFIFLLSRKGLRQLSPLRMGLVFLIIVLSVKLFVWQLHPELIKQTVPMSLDYILYGVLLAACCFDAGLNETIIRYRKPLFFLGLLLFGGAELCSIKGVLPVEPIGMMLFGVAFTMMLPMMKDLRMKPGLPARLIETISKSAYSIYLSNFLVLHFLFERPFEHILNTPGDPMRALVFFAYVVINILVGYLVYISFERPILRFRDRKTKIEGFSIGS